MAGRPTKLTPDVQNILISAIERGHAFQSACDLAGVSMSSFCLWRNRGDAEIKRLENPRHRGETKPEEVPYLQFSEALTRAEAGMVDNALAAIDAGAFVSNDWRAAAWKLERRKPDDWGQRQKIVLEFNSKELAQLQQIKALLDKLGKPASEMFEDLIAVLAEQEQERG